MDTIVDKIRTIAIVVTLIMLVISGGLMVLYCNYEFKAINEIVKICDAMGMGDFTANIRKKLLNRGDEVGNFRISVSVSGCGTGGAARRGEIECRGYANVKDRTKGVGYFYTDSGTVEDVQYHSECSTVDFRDCGADESFSVECVY